MATRKSVAKAEKPAAKKTSAPADRTDKLIEQIVSLRNKGTKWKDISEKVGLPMGKSILLYEMGSVPKKERITGTDSEIGKAIVRARETDKLSWGRIQARTGMSQGACRAAYEKYSKDPSRGARIGKGGRYPGDSAPAKPKPAAKAGPVKKSAKVAAPAKKVAAKKSANVTPINEAKSAKKKAAAGSVKPRPRKKLSANPGEAMGDDTPF